MSSHATDQFSDEEVKVQGHRTLKTTQNCIVFTIGRAIKLRRIRRRLQTRLTPLLGLIYCWRLRRSAARQLDGRPHVMSALAAEMLSRSITINVHC